MCDEVEEFRFDFDLTGQKSASDDASRVLIERRLEATQWRKSSLSTAVDDEACVEVAPLTRDEAADLTAVPTIGGADR